MIDRLGLNRQINAEIERNFINRKWSSEICTKLYLKYNIPSEITSEILTKKSDINDVVTPVLYCLAKELNIAVNKCFTPAEIKEYESYKYTKSSLSFPYVFENMVEVSEGKQYIGTISTKQLMELRDAQILNYNTNTQRQMQLKTGNNFSYFRIALNRKAVDQIMDLLKSNDFIPNTITLNINPETDYSYQNGKLKIKSEAKFDILDGYHRYIALSNMYNLDKNFDYPMELRVTFFREEIAKQFIYQEDQKTKMTKIDSDAMNKNNVGNKICQSVLEMVKDRLNATNIIRQGILARIIQVLYIKKDNVYQFKEINILSNQIFNTIKEACVDVPELLDKPWTDTFTVLFMIISKTGQLKGKELYEKTTELSSKIKLNAASITVSKLNKALKEKGGDLYVIQ